MKNVYCGLALAFALLASGGRMSAQPDAGGIRIIPLSARADMVSGGDVLVRVSVPASIPVNQVRVSVNGEDATSMFRRDESTHTLIGLATGLKNGAQRAGCDRRRPFRGRRGSRSPIIQSAGPIFSGSARTAIHL